ncbi:MAG: hemerythrin domain-containing protein [Rhodobiaceae bacterium]|nr:hemerythrin domain-containing protein [Rhodobiaceae bacterium]MCC0018724.1 hemerythrin domain-containing protein [Rhodobiaceae bacterium]MCC0052180.1 hemerythrin domain-containing protein [Rhodobiaceae bacterium]MCC0061331.1 hemerythrin domain-containing protein [Rhodobiaceae bacterium]
MADGLELENRTSLPEHMRELVKLFPRDGWATHPNFGALTRFWLDRHGMFRELMTHLHNDARLMADKGMDPQTYARRLSRFGGLFVGQLHEHHTVEDHHYFPLLVAREKPLQAGFDLLDADHHAIDEHLHAFTEEANALLMSANQPEASSAYGLAARFSQTLSGLDRMLDRHLVDEEEIIVPVLLKHGEGSFGG